ncbi:MAG TPA: HlyC/CorC family transporter [Verrucomicrobia bacterium]|nr:HlyC/CorC family transporter [Verrucomicrobiota bacterium]HOB32846.1 hemolysin family protein [Verrucomicrobiota bacterium]HOP96421.1 hemolysin family protein [Verrucomicrobiota bacterium]HPU56427.1 hemolysin family protein [Verrucomicrobiota bacterium]
MDWNAIIGIALKIVAVLVLVMLNGFFVAAEFALVKVRDTQLESLVVKGQLRAKVARRILHNLDAALSATQLGITLASLGLGWIGEPVFASLLAPLLSGIESEQTQHSIAFAVGFSVITFLHIVAGELAPKSLAIRKSLPTSLWVAIPLDWFYKVSFPAIWALNHAANWLLRRFGIEPVTEGELVHSEEELRLILGASQKHAGSSALRRSIVLNALDLRQRVAREVMTPRQEMVVLDTQASMTECLDTADKTRYSRFPLCEAGDLDRTLGVIHIKDLYAMRIKARSGADLLPVARKLIYVPETARLEKLLQMFLERRSHIAIVVDEYGGTMGMVTLEDILEELVGQIQDEFDQEKPPLMRVSEDEWEAEGSLPLHELEEVVGETLREEGVTTASGWVTRRLGGFPKAGDVLHVGPFELRVEEMDNKRVARLRIIRKTKAAESS